MTSERQFVVITKKSVTDAWERLKKAEAAAVEGRRSLMALREFLIAEGRADMLPENHPGARSQAPKEGENG